MKNVIFPPIACHCECGETNVWINGKPYYPKLWKLCRRDGHSYDQVELEYTLSAVIARAYSIQKSKNFKLSDACEQALIEVSEEFLRNLGELKLQINGR